MTKLEQLKITIANLEMDLRMSRACTAEYRELIDSFLDLIADIINERDEAKRELASFTEQGMREAP